MEKIDDNKYQQITNIIGFIAVVCEIFRAMHLIVLSSFFQDLLHLVSPPQLFHYLRNHLRESRFQELLVQAFLLPYRKAFRSIDLKLRGKIRV